MDNISYIDIAILLPVLIGLVRGLMQGLVKESISIAAVVVAIIVTRIWGPEASAWLVKQISLSTSVCQVIAYAVVFIAVCVVCNLIGSLISKLLKAIHLGWMDRLLGGLFGAIKWSIIVLVIVYAVNLLDEQFNMISTKSKNNSICYKHTVKTSKILMQKAKNGDLSFPGR